MIYQITYGALLVAIGYTYNLYRVVPNLPDRHNAVLPSLSVTTTVTASFSRGYATAAWTAPMDPTKRRTGATTPRVGPTSSVVGTTLAFPDFFIVLAHPTAPTVATKKTAVSPHRTL